MTNGLLGAILQTGALGVLCWLVYHTHSKTLPDILDRFDKSLKAQHTEFSKEIQLNRVDHRADMETLKAMGEKMLKMADRFESLEKELFDRRVVPDHPMHADTDQKRRRENHHEGQQESGG